MSCTLCSFENMPDAERCARCGARLLVASGVSRQDLIPPRAGAQRRLGRLRYLPERIQASAGVGALRRLGRSLRVEGDICWGSMLCGVVPGLPQYLAGRPRRAAFFAGGWMLLALAYVFVFAGPGEWVVASALLSVHACCLVDAGLTGVVQPSRRDRLWVLIPALLLTFCLYAAVDALLDALVYPAEMREDWPVLGLQRGDTVLCWSAPPALTDIQRGDLLAFTSTRSTIVRVASNLAVDLRVDIGIPGRVLALPGDEVSIRGQTISVNGVQIPEGELPDEILPGQDVELELTVPPGRVLVPFSLQLRGRAVREPAVVDATWRSAYLIDASELRGRVFLVQHPFRRRGFVQRRAIQPEGGQ